MHVRPASGERRCRKSSQREKEPFLVDDLKRGTNTEPQLSLPARRTKGSVRVRVIIVLERLKERNDQRSTDAIASQLHQSDQVRKLQNTHCNSYPLFNASLLAVLVSSFGVVVA